jgi:hypothetical protein
VKTTPRRKRKNQQRGKELREKTEEKQCENNHRGANEREQPPARNSAKKREEKTAFKKIRETNDRHMQRAPTKKGRRIQNKKISAQPRRREQTAYKNLRGRRKGKQSATNSVNKLRKIPIEVFARAVELHHGDLEIVERSLDQRVVRLEVVQEVVPENRTGQNARVAQHDQAVFRPRQRHIQPPRIIQEANPLRFVK